MATTYTPQWAGVHCSTSSPPARSHVASLAAAGCARSASGDGWCLASLHALPVCHALSSACKTAVQSLSTSSRGTGPRPACHRSSADAIHASTVVISASAMLLPAGIAPPAARGAPVSSSLLAIMQSNFSTDNYNITFLVGQDGTIDGKDPARLATGQKGSTTCRVSRHQPLPSLPAPSGIVTAAVSVTARPPFRHLRPPLRSTRYGFSVYARSAIGWAGVRN